MKNKILLNRPICVLIIFAIVFGCYGMFLLINGSELSMYVNYGKDYEYINSQVVFGDNDETESDVFEVKSIQNHDGFVKAVIKANSKGSEKVKMKVCTVNKDTGDSKIVGEIEKIKTGPFNIILENLYQHTYIVLIVLSFLLTLYYIFYFRNTVRTKRYSYNTIFFLYVILLFALLNVIWISASVYAFIVNHTTSSIFIYSLNQNLMIFLTFATIPFMAIFIISVSVSNIALMRKEGFRPANALGIITSIAMLCGLIAVCAAQFLSKHYSSVGINVIFAILSSLYLFFVINIVSAIIYGIYIAKYVPKYDKDYIIILGCKIKDDGTLYPLIKGRVDKAIDFYKKQLEKTGKEAYFVPSGGKGSDEIISEAEAMKRYLIENGIPENRILAETKSTTTRENMLFSKEIIDSKSENAKIVFSTTSYHVFRSGAIAYSNNINIEGIGSKTKWYFWPNAFLREVAGIFTAQPKKQILITVLIALSAGLGSFIYSLF
ncbi:MAG: YdcF family protein [Clostridia bacterium]|nr:YdcF family protein [Clostridia bacterium]